MYMVHGHKDFLGILIYGQFLAGPNHKIIILSGLQCGYVLTCRFVKVEPNCL